MLIIWISLVQIMLVHSTPATYTVCVDTSICNKTVDSEDENIEDNSAVVFSSTQSSTVVLDCVIHIANKSNISLCGSSGNYTEIFCQGTESGIKFTNVTNLTLSRILFVGCGNPANVTIGNDTPTISAIWFYYCENMWLTDITVRDSTGTAIVFVDNVGYIEVNHSSFENNTSSSYGGGVHVRFNPHKAKDAYRRQQGSCNIVFHNNTFTQNSAPLDNNTESFLDKQHLLAVNKWSGQGGGLTFHFEDDTEKLVKVTDCRFTNNSGHHGGGMTLNFIGSTTNNNVIVRNCRFINNEADLGGGLSVTFAHNSHNNSILLSHL